MLTQKNKSYLFDFLGYYESIKKEPHKFHFNDATLQNFLMKNRIFVGSFSKKSENECKKLKYRRFIKIKKTSTDAAHNILRHIRNAIAHNKIKYERKNIIKLEDYNSNSGNITMKATMTQDMLISLIEEIKKTYI